MAVVALVVWAGTIAVGVYLLATSTRHQGGAAAEAERVPATVAVKPAASKKERFDPPSLRVAKSEPLPGLRALGEFTHPALAAIGFAFWLLFALVHDRIFGAIALGVVVGAIAAGVSLAVANGRAAKKEDGGNALSFSGRTLALHVTGAAATLLLVAVLIALPMA
ncbi:MAG: hypothetical protein J2P25_16140 [Nocardiopsaceae bacterium]|nr:hypothetical protein [Nocardiopsaceae bacterium]